MTFRASRLALVTCVAFAELALFLAPDVASANDLRTVALTGQAAPGMPSGVNFSNGFQTPVLNDAGQTAFVANVAGSDVTNLNNRGVWSEGSGSLGLVARTGSKAPGISSGESIFAGFSVLVLNDIGQTAFHAFVGGRNDGIWSEGSGSLSVVAHMGSQAPGTASGVNFSTLGPLALNNAGQTAFSGSLTGSGVEFSNRYGIWSEGSGNLALLARNGDLAAGIRPRANYSDGTLRPFPAPVLNDAGQSAFRAFLAGLSVDDTNNSGIWIGQPGSLVLAAREGNQAPGLPEGVNFAGFINLLFSSLSLNDSGQIALMAQLTGNGVDSTNDEGVWSGGMGNLMLVARKGTQPPGMPAGVNFESFDDPPVINNAGQTAFRAALTTSSGGIWSEGTGSLAMVASRGVQAPGTPNDVNFSSFGFLSLVLNDAGQTAFFATVAGNGVNDSNNDGIWATDSAGELQLIAREGDMLEVMPGDSRTISALSFIGGTGNSDGRPSGFNNLGQLAFRAVFTDGSQGIFVSNRVAISEPSAFALAALAILMVCLARNRTCLPAWEMKVHSTDHAPR